MEEISESENNKHQRYYLGTHLLAEFFGCQDNIENLNFVRRALKEAALACGAIIIHSKFHKFSPHGLTGYLLLSQSHLAIHTWPEHNYAAVDIFTCGSMDPKKAIEYLKNKLKVSKVKIKEIRRGIV